MEDEADSGSSGYCRMQHLPKYLKKILVLVQVIFIHEIFEAGVLDSR